MSARLLLSTSCALALCLQSYAPVLALRSSAMQRGQRPTFGAEVIRVRVDVVAVDGNGRFVDDLRASDFVVLEDGEPQEIVDLQLVDVGEGRIYDSQASTPAGGDALLAVAESPAGNDVLLPGAELGAVIYLVDGLGLPPRTQVRFSTRWSAELAKQESLAVPQALYRIDEIGQVGEVVSLTENISQFKEGVEQLEELAEADLFQDLRIREPALQRFDLLEQFCDALAGRSGRTVLVFVSTGVSLMKGASPDLRVLRAQKAMHEAANSANVSVYSVDPSFMYEIIGTGIDMSRQQGTSVRARAGSGRDERGNSLRHAAAATGGRAFVGWADLDRVLDIIEQDTARYYLLTYAPRRAQNDGAYHSLKVEVARPGVRLRTRQGYVDDPADVREAKRLSGALSLPGATGSIPMTVEVAAEQTASGEPSQRIHVSMSAATFQTEISDAGTGMVRATVHIGVVTEDGETVLYRSTPITHRAGGTSAGRERGGALPEDSVTHSETISLPPGDYELRVVVVDENSERMGADSLKFSVVLGEVGQ